MGHPGGFAAQGDLAELVEQGGGGGEQVMAQGRQGRRHDRTLALGGRLKVGQLGPVELRQWDALDPFDLDRVGLLWNGVYFCKLPPTLTSTWVAARTRKGHVTCFGSLVGTPLC